MKRGAVYIIIASLLSHSHPTHAQSGLRIFTENDFLSFFARNKDDNYTGGLKIEAVIQKPEIFSFPFLLKNKLPRRTLYQTIAFAGTAFTPQDLATPGIVKNDRPYASVLAFSFGSQYISTRNARNRFGFELLGGQMGKPKAGEVQGKIHRHEILKFISTDRPDPKGWHNQIAEGGAFVMNLRLNHEHLLSQPSTNKNYFDFFRLSLRNSINAGNYMINSTHGIRINLFNKQYDFEHEVAPPEIIEKNAKIAAVKKPRIFSFSFFAEPRIKLNIHNAGLTGKLLSGSSVHTIYTTTYPAGLTPVLFEYETGVVMRYYFLQAGYSLYGRSKEFAAQNKKMHHWGGVFIGFIFYR